MTSTMRVSTSEQLRSSSLDAVRDGDSGLAGREGHNALQQRSELSLAASQTARTPQNVRTCHSGWNALGLSV